MGKQERPIEPLNLRIPGPTECPQRVLELMQRPMINHRGVEFGERLGRINEQLRGVFQTKNDVLIVSSSGTGGMQAALVNTLSPGDEVLAVSIGSFGNRFATLAREFGANVRILPYEWGEAANPDDIGGALDSSPEIKAVLVTHNETSTGVTNPLEKISRVVKAKGKLLIVDGVSSVGCIDVQTDEWGLDVVVTASQKGFMIPPGLAFVSMSKEAWEAYPQSRMPKGYFDLGLHKKYAEKGQPPWTAPVSLFPPLELALQLMKEEGLQNIFERHNRLAERLRRGVLDLGLKLLARDSTTYSDTVTAIKVPEGLRASDLVARMINLGVEPAAGQDKLADAIIRIGHMGYVNETKIDETLEVLGQALHSF